MSTERIAPQPSTFRLALQAELLRRCERNPGYTLRAFARSLQISPTSLCLILKGERKVSEKTFHRVSAHLGLGPEELACFGEDVAPATGEVPSFRQLSADRFAVISDWYHFALLELCLLKDFKPEPRWIARRLGITVSEVNAAIERLIRLELLSIDHDTGAWTVSSACNTNDDESWRTAAHRKYQKQILALALKAVEETPVEQRDQTSLTVAISRKRYAEATRRITKFRRELNELLEQDPDREEVYQLSVSFFPLTQSIEKGH